MLPSCWEELCTNQLEAFIATCIIIYVAVMFRDSIPRAQEVFQIIYQFLHHFTIQHVYTEHMSKVKTRGKCSKVVCGGVRAKIELFTKFGSFSLKMSQN